MLDTVPHLPEQKHWLLEHLVDRLSRVTGVAALVLGGSYASGTYHETSDMDVGLYYFEAEPFALAAIQRIAQEISVDGAATVTGLYEWGAWVNGGAWIPTPHGKVDVLYRNVNHIHRTIAEAHEGISHHDYDQQPTYGFYSVMYLAETDICIPLYDPELIITKLKRAVESYPLKLKQNIIQNALWSAEFSLIHARSFADQGDIYNTVGCLTRVVSSMIQALFAVNERYFMRDKQVLEVVATFAHLPHRYIEQINHILAYPGSTVRELTQTVSDLQEAWRSVVALPNVAYEPKFQM